MSNKKAPKRSNPLLPLIGAEKAEHGVYWSDPWNPLEDSETGRAACTKVSPGCDHCWSEAMNRRTGGPLFDRTRYQFALNSRKLKVPLQSRKRRVFFVQNTSDLFHRDVPDLFLQMMWGVMSECPEMLFLVLTKRTRRQRQFVQEVAVPQYGVLPNVIIGATIENAAMRDHRLGDLVMTPAAQRWVSLEPLLSPVEMGLARPCPAAWNLGDSTIGEHLHWLVCGAESGGKARPMAIEWAEDLCRESRHAGVAFWMKQLHADGRLVKDMAAFPRSLRYRQLPAIALPSNRTLLDRKEV